MERTSYGRRSHVTGARKCDNAQFSLLCTRCVHHFDVYEGDDELVRLELCPLCYIRREAKIKAGIYWTIVAFCGGCIYLVCKVFGQ
jgi:hypothetical protein